MRKLQKKLIDTSAVGPIGPVCPKDFGPLAREEWERIVPELAKIDALTQLDRAILAVYCRAFEQWIELLRSIKEFGAIVKSPNGYPVQSPYVAIANRAVDDMLRVATEYGFTPASRKRIFPPEFKSYTYDIDGNKIEM